MVAYVGRLTQMMDPVSASPKTMFSNNNLTLTAGSVDAIQSARSLVGVDVGEQKMFSAFFEALLPAAPNTHAFGATNDTYDNNQAENPSDSPGTAANACMLYDHQNGPDMNGVRVVDMGFAGFVAGDIVDIAISRKSGDKIWFRINGGVWNGTLNGDPVTGANGVDITTVGASGTKLIYPIAALGGFTGFGQGIVTVNLNGPFPFPIPAGFEQQYPSQEPEPVDTPLISFVDPIDPEPPPEGDPVLQSGEMR